MRRSGLFVKIKALQLEFLAFLKQVSCFQKTIQTIGTAEVLK